MHIALVCPIALGHLNPMATLGRELARRGHRVSLVGSPRAQPKADAFGLGLVLVGMPEYQTGELQNMVDQLADLKGLAAMKLTGEIFRRHSGILLRDGPAALRADGVEAVVVDQASPAGMALADALGLPYVIACDALAMHQEPDVPPSVLGWKYRPGALGRLRNRTGNKLLELVAKPIFAVVSEFRVRNGLTPFRMQDSFEAGLAQIAQQPEFFDFPRKALPAHFHYTGPWHEPARDSESTPFPWEKLDGRPLVYASLGTMQNRLQHVFEAILEACADLPLQVVLSLGKEEAQWDGTVPSNAIVVPFAPQLTLLDRASVLITHAGLNTVLEGLARGLPMLCIPVTNDQPGVSRRVEWLGAGEVLPLGNVSAARIRTLVEKLLAGAHRQAAQKYRDLLRANPGVVRAADIVEEAFRSGKRVAR